MSGEGSDVAAQGRGDSWFVNAFTSFIRVALVMSVVRLFLNSARPPPRPGAVPMMGETDATLTNEASPLAAGAMRRGETHGNLFRPGQHLDLFVYLSESESFPQQGSWREEQSDAVEARLVWQETEVPLDFSSEAKRSINISWSSEDSERFQRSEEGDFDGVYVHAFLARTGTYSATDANLQEHLATAMLPAETEGAGADMPSAQPGRREPVLYTRKNLVRYFPKPKPRASTRKLLDSSSTSSHNDAPATSSSARPDISTDGEDLDGTTQQPTVTEFWAPQQTLSLVVDFTEFPYGGIPPQLSTHMSFVPGTHGRTYLPIFAPNDFWMLRDKYRMMRPNVTAGEDMEADSNGQEDESDTFQCELTLEPLAMWKFLMYSQMDESFALQQQMGTMSDNEPDNLKRILLEGNPYLLVITGCVSILHTVFDLLAFKNDISFWRQNKSMEGLSARSIVINFFCHAVIFLYLLDNETSWVVLFSSFLGLLIEAWKIGKAMVLSLTWKFGFLPWPKLDDKKGYKESATKRYDQQATLYLSYVMYPLFTVYAIYCLYYKEYKSWYSWVLNTLVGAVYTFGFIMMTPQLFINYKLKSVAHLPWRQMTYKFLNTIIDDLFAFVIKMPLMHRLSVFRDDLIFLIYLYQRWIYRVDKTRVNEYGFASDEADTPAINNESKVAATGHDGAPSDAASPTQDTAIAKGPASADGAVGGDRVPSSAYQRKAPRDLDTN